MNYMTLKDINEGSTCIIKKINTTGAMRRRLMDIGMIEGTKVECVLKSPSGDSLAYLIRGAVIALRNEDSSKVMIEF